MARGRSWARDKRRAMVTRGYEYAADSRREVAAVLDRGMPRRRPAMSKAELRELARAAVENPDIPITRLPPIKPV